MNNQTNESNNQEFLLRKKIGNILANKSIDQAITDINEEIGKLYQVDRVYIRYYDQELKIFSDVIGEYRADEEVISVRLKVINSTELDEFLYNELISKNQDIVIDNIDEASLPEKIKDIWKSTGVISELVVPVLYQDRPLAAIFMSSIRCVKPFHTEYIELINSITDQIGAGLNIFRLNDRLKKTSAVETAVIDLIYEIRRFNTHDEIFNYMLNKLVDILNANRALHLHYDENKNLTVVNEAVRNGLESLLDKPILDQRSTEELIPKAYREIIIINNVSIDVEKEDLRDFLERYNIQAFLIYPALGRYPEQVGEKISSITMICSPEPRRWSSDEIQSFKLIIDSNTASYYEIKQRNEFNELRNTFLTTLTHDLRSPIFAEQKALELIMSANPEAPIKGYLGYLQEIYRTNEELLNIVNNILSIYHYEKGKFELELQEINIAELINTSVNVMKPLAEAQNSKIDTHIESHLPLLMADRNEILRVVNNLVSNAIKHNTKGTAINIAAKRIDNDIQLSVSDNGKGIPEDERKNIFQRYPTAKRKIGTGLGLYLSKQIIDAHHGRIWFETEEGKGTTFYFTLPI